MFNPLHVRNIAEKPVFGRQDKTQIVSGGGKQVERVSKMLINGSAVADKADTGAARHGRNAAVSKSVLDQN